MSTSCRNATTAVLLLVLVGAIYGNSLHVPWHLDDYQNISHNPKIRLQTISLTAIEKALESPGRAKMDRPLSRLGLALNWYFDRNDPFGYHLVNIIMHWLNACLLAALLLQLFKTPSLAGGYRSKDARFIALLAAVLWAVNPVQTQAVTYVVQRMAVQAALFYLLGLYLYVNARNVGKARRSILLFAAAFVCFAMACLSKENAATLPLAVLLVEAVFYQDLGDRGVRRNFLLLSAGVTGLIVLAGLAFFFNGDPSAILNYSSRSFTPMERLLTQPRVLVFYLSQLFYPAPTRLSVQHDVVVSTSLLQPWTTLPAILIICGLTAIAVWQIRKRPLTSFAILFFFLNHLIESSIIGLELVFEHRNYLPSLFLFVPAAAGLNWLINHYRTPNAFMRAVIGAFVVLLIVGLGSGAHIRNRVWNSSRSLWEDAAAKAPRSGRPLHNLAYYYYQPERDYERAEALYRRSLELTRNNAFQNAATYNNLASIYYAGGNYESAADCWEKARKLYPRYTPVLHHLALSYLHLGDLSRAEERIDEYLQGRPHSAAAQNLKGIILYCQQRYSAALEFFRQCLRQNPFQKAANINIGAVFSRLGDFQKAEFFLENAKLHTRDPHTANLWLADIYQRQQLVDSSERVMDELLAGLPLDGLLERIGLLGGQQFESDAVLLPDDGWFVRKALTRRLLSMPTGCIE
jgi:tetratricopeptide (TPR) repeat protein